jgi:hypothetical protein
LGDALATFDSPAGRFTGAAALFDGPPTSASARLRFSSPQDWRDFNRLSLWCYLHPTVNTANSRSLQFLCQGASAGPAEPVSLHYIGDLRPGEWNHLVWEISEYQRDAVVEFLLSSRCRVCRWPRWRRFPAGKSPPARLPIHTLAISQVR